MPRNWHAIFETWQKPPSDTEQEKADNAARMIGDALRADSSLGGRDFTVYASGSYRNNTNVRLDSDVDTAVVFNEAWFCSYPEDERPNAELLGFVDAKYGLPQFRDDIEKALVKAFGRAGVTAGDKAFDVHENSYRLDADAAVFLQHRRYTGDQNASGGWLYWEGVEMRPRKDPSKRIINWHQQHYDQGVARNEATKRRFKRVTRILKRLRNEMLTEGDQAQKAAAEKAPSFLIECLVFNAPDDNFNRADHYYDDVKAVVATMWTRTKPGAEDVHSKLVEVSRMKYLFRSGQPWAVADAHEFLLQAWQYVGF